MAAHAAPYAPLAAAVETRSLAPDANAFRPTRHFSEFALSIVSGPFSSPFRKRSNYVGDDTLAVGRYIYVWPQLSDPRAL